MPQDSLARLNALKEEQSNIFGETLFRFGGITGKNTHVISMMLSFKIVPLFATGLGVECASLHLQRGELATDRLKMVC